MNLIASAILTAFLSAPLAASGPTIPPPSHPFPNIPTNPVKRGPGQNRFTPNQLKSGVYQTPTPVPIQRKINVVADLELSIVPGDKSFELHVLSSLPVRNLLATNRSTGTDLADVKLDDSIDFTVVVDGQPNSAVALTLDVNMGVFKGKARIRKATFDLMESAQETAAQAAVEADKIKEKNSPGDEPLPAELKNEPAPE